MLLSDQTVNQDDVFLGGESSGSSEGSEIDLRALPETSSRPVQQLSSHLLLVCVCVCVCVSVCVKLVK